MAALLLALALLFPSPVSASHNTTHVRCNALTRELNKWRSPDVRLYYLLCRVGRVRADYILRTGDRRHNLNPVIRELAKYGVCWRNVGEVLATTNHPPPLAAYFVKLWRTLGAKTHWPILMASRFDRGGGTWRWSGGRAQAVYYVVDICGE